MPRSARCCCAPHAPRTRRAGCSRASAAARRPRAWRCIPRARCSRRRTRPLLRPTIPAPLDRMFEYLRTTTLNHLPLPSTNPPLSVVLVRGAPEPHPTTRRCAICFDECTHPWGHNIDTCVDQPACKAPSPPAGALQMHCSVQCKLHCTLFSRAPEPPLTSPCRSLTVASTPTSQAGAGRLLPLAPLPPARAHPARPLQGPSPAQPCDRAHVARRLQPS